MIDNIKEMVENRLEIIRKFLQQDGGDLELISIDENKEIKIKLIGVCKTCPHANDTLKNFIERDLKQHIDNDIVVKKV